MYAHVQRVARRPVTNLAELLLDIIHGQSHPLDQRLIFGHAHIQSTLLAFVWLAEVKPQILESFSEVISPLVCSSALLNSSHPIKHV